MEKCKNFTAGQLLCNKEKTFIVLTNGYHNRSCQTFQGIVMYDAEDGYEHGDLIKTINHDVTYLYDGKIKLLLYNN